MLYLGDAAELILSVESDSISAVISDPPYPEVDREYGRQTEDDWFEMMKIVVTESKRVLVENGSAVFVLQPNSKKVGSLRGWLWKFLAWCHSEWNIVQDVWWWNPAAMPSVHCQRRYGLMRPSIKMCVWLGNSDCYRCQENVLWQQSDGIKAVDREKRALQNRPSGYTVRDGRMATTAAERGGTTPFNLIPVSNTNSSTSGGAKGHGAATPYQLCEWWVRYICPQGGIVLDPFCGSGTVARAAFKNGCGFLGFEKFPKYYEMAMKDLTELYNQLRNADK